MLTLTTFTASEAERITGRSPFSQRQDRAEKLMPSIGRGRARARHDLVALARMRVLQVVSDKLGRQVSSAATWAARASYHIAHWALHEQGLVTDTKWLQSSPYGDREAHAYLVASGRDNSTTNDIARTMQGLRTNAGCKEVFVILDLRDLGRSLAQRARQPLAKIEP